MAGLGDPAVYMCSDLGLEHFLAGPCRERLLAGDRQLVALEAVELEHVGVLAVGRLGL